MHELRVIGIPVTQGSHSAISTPAGPRVVEGKGAARQKHRSWREAVAAEARDYQTQHLDGLIDAPVIVRLLFSMPKPASAPKRKRTWPAKARSGDIDKLARACLDALTGTLIADDSRVVALCALKDWGDPPGVRISVLEVDETIARLLIPMPTEVLT